MKFSFYYALWIRFRVSIRIRLLDFIRGAGSELPLAAEGIAQLGLCPRSVWEDPS